MPWNDPPTIVAVTDDTSDRIYHDGNVYRRQADITVDEDTLARMKLGYLCLRCFEPQEVPFPARCSLCSYSIADCQAADIAAEFDGAKHIGPSTTIDEELDRMALEREYRDFKPKTSIWVPGK